MVSAAYPTNIDGTFVADYPHDEKLRSEARR
jgi:hypothetical protein